MASKFRLSKEEKLFFSIVKNAIQANPFSEERRAIDMKIAGLLNISHDKEALERTIIEVRKRVKTLNREGRADLNLYSESDRELLKRLYLFDFFHLFVEEFDQHIEKQIIRKEESLKVNFSDQALSYLLEKGFPEVDAIHFFEMSYQLRRAFYFIDRSLVGKSSSMTNLRESLWNNVFTNNIELYDEYLWNRMEDFSTLVLGETGTGKGSAAMSIGRSGFIPFDIKRGKFVESFSSSFVPLNLSQFPESIIESELFGHSKGAFTGAVKDQTGVFGKCSPHGAIFLDEIGEITESIQVKLLKVLEEREFSPVGSRELMRFEGRVIAATNRSVDDLKQHNLMRDDFFYRLCSDIIVVPPLRQRIKEDPAELNDLVGYTIMKIIGRESKDLTEMVLKVINKSPGKNYEWPGNVRELGQCIRRVLLNQSYTKHTAKISSDIHPEFIRAMGEGSILAQDLIKQYCRHLYDMFGTYGEVARRTGLDRRTVKKYIDYVKQ